MQGSLSYALPVLLFCLKLFFASAVFLPYPSTDLRFFHTKKVHLLFCIPWSLTARFSSLFISWFTFLLYVVYGLCCLSALPIHWAAFFLYPSSTTVFTQSHNMTTSKVAKRANISPGDLQKSRWGIKKITLHIRLVKHIILRFECSMLEKCTQSKVFQAYLHGLSLCTIYWLMASPVTRTTKFQRISNQRHWSLDTLRLYFSDYVHAYWVFFMIKDWSKITSD